MWFCATLPGPKPRARTDFDGYVLFEGLPFGTFSAEEAGQTDAALTVSREAPDGQGKVLIPAANGAKSLD